MVSRRVESSSPSLMVNRGEREDESAIDAFGPRAAAGEPVIDRSQSVGLPFPGVITLDETSAIFAEFRTLRRIPLEQFAQTAGDAVARRLDRDGCVGRSRLRKVAGGGDQAG